MVILRTVVIGVRRREKGWMRIGWCDEWLVIRMWRVLPRSFGRVVTEHWMSIDTDWFGRRLRLLLISYLGWYL